MTFKIKLDENAFPLSKAYFTDAGYDIKTPISFEIKPKSTFIVNTGVHVQIPHEYAGLIVSKSGLNINHDITSTGLIDEGYIGPIIVKLYNNGNNTYYFNRGDKITQLLLVKTSYFNIEIVDSLDENLNSNSNNKIQRGYNGFGSSGK
jgi:dUTP pyrophosphatase